MVNVIVWESVPMPCEANATPVYCNVQLPNDLPIFVRRSVAVVLNVISGAAVPAVGLAAKRFIAKRGVARFVSAVIFFNELLTPQSKLVLELVTVI